MRYNPLKTRTRIVVFAVMASVLLMSTPGMVGASTSSGAGLVVGSSHSTATELQSAQTLQNLTVSGSGESATVSLAAGGGTYNIIDDSGDGAADNSRSMVGDTAGDTVIGTEWQAVPTQSGRLQNLTVNINGVVGSDYGLRVDVFAVQESPDSTAGEGTLIANDWNPSWTTGPQTIQLDTPISVQQGETWTFEFVPSGGDSDGTADHLKLATDENSGLTNWASDYVNTLEDWGGDITLGYQTTVSSASYLSAVHNVSTPEHARINLAAASNVSVTATVRTTSGSVLNQTTITSTGSHLLTLASTSSSTIEVHLRVDVTGSNPSFSLDAESILFTNHAPAVSSPSPTGNLSTSTPTFTLDITDPEFGTAQGDSINASLYVDSSYQGSDTLSSNGTASVTAKITGGGSHDYYWVVNDSYGATTTTSTYTVRSPASLKIYDSVNYPDLVDNATVDIKIYSNETGTANVYTRNTTTGTLNLTGLPVNQPMTLVAHADNYTSRRIYIPSVYEQQAIYLLPTSAKTVDTIFSLNDYTGKYASENTVLLVQRSINESYQTVLGDSFGATGEFPAILKYDTRHRLVLLNTKTGDERVLGTYTPITSSTQQIVVTPTGVGAFEGAPPQVVLKPTAQQLPAVSDADLSITVDQGDTTVSAWNTTITYVNGSTETILVNQSYTSPDTLTRTLDLTGKSSGYLHVTVQYTADGVTLTRAYNVSILRTYSDHTTLLDAVSNLATLSPAGHARSTFTMFLAMLVTIFGMAGVASVIPNGEIAGLSGVFMLAGFSVIGWVSYSMVFVSMVGLGSFAALRRGL